MLGTRQTTERIVHIPEYFKSTNKKYVCVCVCVYLSVYACVNLEV